MTDYRDMTDADVDRLRTHHRAHHLFKGLMKQTKAVRVAELNPSSWAQLRTLLELGFINVEDGQLITAFTVSSLVKLGYVS